MPDLRARSREQYMKIRKDFFSWEDRNFLFSMELWCIRQGSGMYCVNGNLCKLEDAGLLAANRRDS